MSLALSPSLYGDPLAARRRGPLYTVSDRGTAYFTRPPRSPLDVVNTLHDGRPPILPPEMGALFVGTGRVGYGFSRMAARAPGNERSLLMVVPHDIAAWHSLVTGNRYPQRLPPDLLFNPQGEKEVHILPPRDVAEKMVALEGMANREPDRWRAVFEWANSQLQDERVRQITDYWLASAQVQALTTRVGGLSEAVDSRFVKGLYPQVPYVFIHATKSMGPARHEGGRPLFGHEVLQALLEEGGRGDLAGSVVASAGYWVETTVAARTKVRIRLTSTESRQAVEAARLVLEGSVPNPLVAASMDVGRQAVFMDQIGGAGKNIIVSVLGMLAARAAMRIDLEKGRGREGGVRYSALDRYHAASRNGLIKYLLKVAQAAIRDEEGLTEPPAVQLAEEVREDIEACSSLSWPALITEGTRYGLFDLRKKQGTRLGASEIASLREGIKAFVKGADVMHFGSTNQTFSLAAGLAYILAENEFIESARDVMDTRITIPEGVRAMPHFIDRFGDNVPPRLTLLMEAFRPYWRPV